MNIKKKIVYIILVVSATLLIYSILEQGNRDFEKGEVELQKEEDKEGNTLQIEKINLKLPIKHGATHDNMRYSAATMTHKEVQEGKNFTLAGHRNIRKGKNFNRLNEVEIGDEIKVQEGKEVYKFKVNKKYVVLPEDINILEDTGDTEITLITCYPISVSTHRLVIKGVKEE